MTDLAVDRPASALGARQSILQLSWPLALLALAVLAYALFFSHLTLTRYAAYVARAQDLGNLDQAIWNNAFGEWFRFTNYEGLTSRLSLHVEPILIPISWLYYIHPGPQTLLVLQAVVVALGAVPLFALARHKLHSDWLALVFAVVFLLNPSMQAANWLEFHPVTLAPTFLMAAFYYLVVGRMGLFSLFAVLAASCKEDVVLLVFMLGLYGWLALGRRRAGLITMALAATWAFLAVFVIQHTFATSNIHWDRYAYLGDTPVEMVLSLITKPGLIWQQLVAVDVLRYFWLLLLPVAFTPLAALEVLFLALPSFAINLLADFPPMHQVTELFYAAPIVPFVMVAAVMGVARLQRRMEPWVNRQAFLWSAALLLLLAAGVSQHLFGYLPGGANHRLYTVTDHHRRGDALIATIPPDAAVSAQDRLNPHVSSRRTVYIYPRVADADTVLVDVTGPAWPQHPNDLYTSVRTLLDGEFGVQAAVHGYLLLAKGAPKPQGNAFPADFYQVWQTPLPDGAPLADFDDRLRLHGVEVTDDRFGELVVKMDWSALEPLEEDLRVYVAYLAPDGTPLHDSLFYPPVASLWYPTHLWTPDQGVRITTLPWTLAQDRFVLAVGLYQGEGGWNEGRRLAVTDQGTDLPLLEGETLLRIGGFQRTEAGWAPVSGDAATPATPLNVRFGPVRLLGATVARSSLAPGEDLVFDLHWQAEDPAPLDYSIFAHLLNAQGDKVAQLDWQPHDATGVLPLTAWPVGWQGRDRQQLAVPVNATPGTYRLIVGVYDWQSGLRVPAEGAPAEPGHVVTVTTVQVE